MEFDLIAIIPEDINDADAQALEATDAVPPSDATPRPGDGAALTDGVQSVQAERVKANVRKPRKKVSAVVDQVMASEPTPGAEHRPEAEMLWPPVVTPSKSVERKLTKRQAAAVQLPRHERWKRRLHPASW
jgi:hypothetical protein